MARARAPKHTDRNSFDYIELRCIRNERQNKHNKIVNFHNLFAYCWVFVHAPEVAMPNTHFRALFYMTAVAGWVTCALLCRVTRTPVHSLSQCNEKPLHSPAQTTIIHSDIHFPNELRESENKTDTKRSGWQTFCCEAYIPTSLHGWRSLAWKLLPVYVLWLLLLLILLLALICTRPRRKWEIIKIKMKYSFCAAAVVDGACAKVTTLYATFYFMCCVERLTFCREHESSNFSVSNDNNAMSTI